jgi:hypothetical protein
MRQKTTRGADSNATTLRSQEDRQRSSCDSVAQIPKNCPCFFLARTALLVDSAMSDSLRSSDRLAHRRASPSGTLIEGAAVFIDLSPVNCVATASCMRHRAGVSPVMPRGRETCSRRLGSCPHPCFHDPQGIGDTAAYARRRHRGDTACASKPLLPMHSVRQRPPRVDSVARRSDRPVLDSSAHNHRRSKRENAIGPWL